MGFAGSLHCAGMCGPLALALPAGNSRSRFVAGRMLYNAGRVATYTALGILFGLAGKTFVLAGLQRSLSIAVGLVLLSWLVVRMNRKLFIATESFVPRLVAPVKSALARRIRSQTMPAQFAFGLLNGLLPCGLVYLALAGAAGTGSATDGALFMLVFGAGTLPMMLAISMFGKLIHAGIRAKFQQAIPAMICTLAVLFILRGLSLGIPYLSPDISPTALASGHSCCR
jgi:sulfite exporter TauE/SafE